MVQGEGRTGLLIVGDWGGGKFPAHRLQRLYWRATEGRSLLTDCWVNTEGYVPAAVQPKFVLWMGRELCGKMKGDILRWRGRVIHDIIPSMFTLAPEDLKPHKGGDDEGPKGLRKAPSFTGAAMLDIARALNFAEKGVPLEPVYKHICDPDLTLFRNFVADVVDYNLAFAWDIETSWGMEKDAVIVTDDFQKQEEKAAGEAPVSILRISFATHKHIGWSVPWTPDFLPEIIKLLSHEPSLKYGWNCHAFDIPEVESRVANLKIRNCMDLMWLWHIYQSDLPMGLEFASSFFTQTMPWKHTAGTEFAWYSAHDAAVTYEIYNGLMKVVTNEQLKLYIRHIEQLHTILREAGQRGNLIDTEAQEALKVKLLALAEETFKELQPLIPEVLQPLHPKNGYVKPPKDLVGDLVVKKGTKTVRFCTLCGKENVNKKHFTKCMGSESTEVVETDKFFTPLPFNPSSQQQLIGYVRYKKHPLGKNKDTGAPSVDKHQLKKLIGLYPTNEVYPRILRYRETIKTKGTYVEGFKPDAQGLIHTSFSSLPSTMRLASRAVNIQNVSKRSSNPLVKEVRRTIIARPGHIFVQADSSAIEAVLTGHYSGVKDFQNLAALGIHDFMSCNELGLEFTPENVDKVKKFHKGVRDRNKTGVYLSLYGGTAHYLSDLMPEIFPKVSDAKAVQDKLWRLFPGLLDWHTSVRELAFKQCYLQNSWGYRHPFYDVYSVGVDGKARPGSDSKRCLAYLPQSAAGCFARDNLLAIGTSKWAVFMPANCTVHDSYCLEVPVAMQEEAVDYLAKLLCRPIMELGGLKVGCEVEVGFNWRDMQTVAKVSPYDWEDWWQDKGKKAA